MAFVGFILPSQAEAVDCTRAPGGNVTISSSCTFPGTVDGADVGSGTSNTADIAVSGGATLTIGAGQTISTGTLTPSGGSIAIISGGQIKIGSPLWMYDADGDGYPKESTMAAQAVADPGWRRRNLMTSLTQRDCQDFYNSGYGCAPSSSDLSGGTHNRTFEESSGNIAGAYHELPADINTVGLWHMNEVSGNVADASGNGNTGTIVGTPSVVTGRLGNGRNFANRSTDRIDVAHSSTTNQDIFTIEGWVKPAGNKVGDDYIVDKPYTSHVSPYYQWTIKYDTGNVIGAKIMPEQNGWAGCLALATPAIPANTWSHFAFTYNNTTKEGRMYYNGELAATGTSSCSMTQMNGGLAFGNLKNAIGNGFLGVIDEIRYSNIARTPEEIKADAQRRPYGVYTAPVNDLGQTPGIWNGMTVKAKGVRTGDGETPHSTNSLVAQWNFNETSGTTASNAAGSCGAACNGTLTNFASTSSQDQAAGTGWTSANRRWGAGALMFNNGANNYVSTSYTFNYSTGYSAEAWIKTSATNSPSIINDSRSSAANGIWFGFTGSSLYCYGNKGTAGVGNFGVSSSEAANDGSWKHVACTWDGTTAANGVKIYINGRQVGSTTAVAAVGAATNTITIGKDATTTNDLFSGVMDAVRIYSRALTAAEILANYQAGNIEFQTRTSADNSTWQEWRPVTGETAIDALNNNEDNSKVYELGISNIGVNQNWSKLDNTIPSASDTTSTNGRLPLGTAGKGDVTAVSHPTILKDGSTYKMWYAGNDGTNQFTYYATSPDGLTWTKYNNTTATTCDGTCEGNGKIGGGIPGKNPMGDTDRVLPKTVLKDGSTYKMWYMGRDGTNYRIYYATSSDGLTWTKYDNTTPAVSDTTSSNGRIPLGNSGRGDSAQVSNPVVIKDGNFDIPGYDNYKMWYIGNDGTNSRIFYATSPDGLTWTKYDNTIPGASDTSSTNGRIPLGTSGKADVTQATNPQVIKDGLVYKMWYTGYDSTNYRILYATSFDGLTWTKYDNSIPSLSDTSSTNGRVPMGNSGRGDSSRALEAAVIKDGPVYKLWYDGYDGTNSRIYYASMAPLPLGTSTDTTTKIEGTGSEKLTLGAPQVDGNTVGLWHMDETSGSSYDSTTNSHTLSELGGSPASVDGFFGKARSFNGYNGLDKSSAVSSATTNISMSAWVNPGTLPQLMGTIMHNGDQNTGYGLTIGSDTCCGGSSSKLYLILDGVSWLDTGYTFPSANAWYHVAVTRDTSTWRFYVNGVQTANTYTTSPNTPASGFGMGAQVSAYPSIFRPFNGKVDEASFSTVARTAEEIAEAYRAGRDHRISKTISSTDLSAKTKLPFYIASDRPGTFLEATVGESAYANYEPDADTKGLWHLDENSNGSATVTRKDSSGNGNNLTDNNTVPSTQGKIGMASDFELNNSEYLSIADNSSLSTGDISFSLGAWVNLESEPGEMVIAGKLREGEPNRLANREYELKYNADMFHFMVSDTGGSVAVVSTPAGLSTGTWYYLVGTYDSATDTSRVYLNGQLAGTLTSVTPPNDTGQDFGIGYSAGSGQPMYFDGQIDEVVFIKRKLADDDIRQAYEVGKRTHPVTIDFVTSPQAAYSSGTSVTINNPYGTTALTNTLSVGDTIIFKENVNGTETVGQAVVSAITNTSSVYGTVTLIAAPTFPSGGYSTNAKVFKWQREYFDLTGSLGTHRNAITRLTMRVTDGSQGSNVWLDDFRSASYINRTTCDTLNTTTGECTYLIPSSSVTSALNRYFQLRAIMSTWDTAVSPILTSSQIEFGL